MDRNYGGVIWTNHALERLVNRGIKQGDAWYTFSRPEQSRFATSQGAWIYYRTYNNQRIEVVAKKNEKGQWIILSVWSQPVYQKKNDSKTERDSFFRKILKSLVGG